MKMKNRFTAKSTPSIRKSPDKNPSEIIKTLQNIKGILVDFDGVISCNSLEITMSFAHDYINEYVPYKFETLESFYRSVNSFDLGKGMELLFNSLGLQDKLNDFFSKLRNLRFYKNLEVEIYDDFLPFLDFCKKENISVKMYSMAEESRIRNLLNSKIEIVKLISKTDFRFLKQLHDELKNEKTDWAVIDDDPLALFFASQAGFCTIWRENFLFRPEDQHLYKSFIHFEIKSFTELKSLLIG